MVLPTLLVAFLALPSSGDDRFRIRLKEPNGTRGAMSLDGRLLILAEITHRESLEEAWLEFRIERGEDWRRRSIPLARRIRVSSTGTLVAPVLEPRSLPGVKADDVLWLRISAEGPRGAYAHSGSLEVHLRDAEEREALLASRLEEAQHELEELRTASERDHRKLSRIERRSREAEALDAAARAELQSMDSAGRVRLDRLPRLSRDVSEALEEADTDRLVDSRRADRWRWSIVAVLRDAEGPLSAMRQDLARSERAKTPEERRTALLSALDASDRFLDLLQGCSEELRIWRESVLLRRSLRSMLKGQKEVTEELDRRRRR